MKKVNLIALVAIIFVLLSIAVLSQIGPLITKVSKNNQVTPTINVEETEICKTTFYDELQVVYGNCINSYNYTDCLNSCCK